MRKGDIDARTGRRRFRISGVRRPHPRGSPAPALVACRRGRAGAPRLAPSAGSPTAAPPTPIVRWVSVGAEVELDQGFECALFGCALFGGGDPIWLGDHNGAAVPVVRAGIFRQLKVRAFSGTAGNVRTGWSPAKTSRSPAGGRGCATHSTDRAAGRRPTTHRNGPHSAAIPRAATRPWLAFDPRAPEVFHAVSCCCGSRGRRNDRFGGRWWFPARTRRYR